VTAVAILASYLLGAVPFALITARLRGVDLRAHGSGNLGATNAIRVLGVAVGVPVLLADVAKGLVAVAVIPSALGAEGAAVPLVCGLAAIFGHVWSVFLKFGGGKGVATAAGAFFALAPRGVGIAFAAFVIVLLATRFVSLASITAAITLPVALWGTGASRPVLVAGIALALLVVIRHRSNVARLAAGTESRIRFGGSGKDAT
jgi:glycerol-3-phosphate acyltransferase PlsY